ncbi:glycine oxidase ThiO [Leptolyngbya sp. AN02str]|uniref:glycine oxidase ThiO n=1 Tax=Leptolyngbya sp. AN02str TaxID=3423363 RepID=UPI003D310845
MASANDILVIGGGIVGLAIAIELKLRGAAVTVLSRNFAEAATHAAAGMLAPMAEELPVGPMRELCLQSRARYADWTSKLEDLSGESTGYWACGILAPVFQQPIAQLTSSIQAYWLDHVAIHMAQPGLSPAVVGGWWYPEDGQVDNRALAQVLRSVAVSLGVHLEEGIAVTSLEQRQGRVARVRTTAGDRYAQHYILATGAWSHEVLPVPVQPRKGQMLSLLLPPGDRPVSLQRVLFGEGIYLVPRQDGRIVVGATSESVGFAPGNTPAGVHQLLHETMRLMPGLSAIPIQETWWGFRPATPDEQPILGHSPCENLTLAVGHYRNGILLAPITAQLIADRVWQGVDDPLLAAFSWERFWQPMGANTTASPTAIAKPDNGTRALGTQASSQSFSHASPSNLSHDSTMLQYSTPADVPTQEGDRLQSAADSFVIAGRTFRSRLMTGTGKYPDFETMRQSVVASGCEIVTVAVRRVQTNAPGHEGLGEALDWSQIWMLPNTAGCKTAEEAIRVARLGREMAKLLGQEDNNFIKLEVIPDAKYLLPDPIGTLEAAEQLVKEGFAVLPYINADPLLAKRLEEAGCATVMPLGSPIGSGQGIKNEANIRIIIENATVPVVVDAGIGSPSEAALAMEMGADALLINTAIAQAKNPVAMARAMGLAAEAGRLAYHAGRIPIKSLASASSPLTGTITS